MSKQDKCKHTWEFTWANGSGQVNADTIQQAVRKLSWRRNIEVGLLVQVKKDHKEVKYWSGEKFMEQLILKELLA